jgi:hypothetical protein
MKKTGVVLLAMALGIGAGACVATETAPPARSIVVSGPPPAPIAEDRPPAPSASTAWVPGYWHWTGVQYAWIPGHWENPPPGAVWAGPHYMTHGNTYFYEPGGWHTDASHANALR